MKKFRIASALLAVVLLVSFLVVPLAVAAGQENGRGRGNISTPQDRYLGDEDKADLDFIYTVELSPVRIISMVPQSCTFAVTAGREGIYRNRWGLVVARHWAYTQWACDLRGTMRSSPRNVWNDYWTNVSYWVSSQSASWNWYRTGFGATAQSNCRVTFMSGLPTPWGPVAGNTFTSRCLKTVNGWGRVTGVSWTFW